jgi:hypothetical protein
VPRRKMAPMRNDPEDNAPFEMHPLFPLEEGDEPYKRIEWIGLRKIVGSQFVTLPEYWEAHSLNDHRQIVERYGPGAYELIGRGGGDTGKNWIRTKRRETFGDEDGRADGPGPGAAGPADTALAQMGAAAGRSVDPMMMFMIQMMQSQQAAMTTLMVKSLESSSTILAAVLGNRQQGDPADILKFMATMSQQDRGQMLTLVQAMASSKGGGGGGDLSAFMKGLEFSEKLAGQEADGPSEEESLIDTVQQAIGAAQQFQGIIPPGGAGAAGSAIPFQPPAPKGPNGTT